MNSFFDSVSIRFISFIAVWNWQSVTYLVFGEGAKGRISGVFRELNNSMFMSQSTFSFGPMLINVVVPIGLAVLSLLYWERLTRKL